MQWHGSQWSGKSSFEVSFVLIGSPARQWNGPAAPQLVVPADGTCFSGPVFHTDPPPPHLPPPSHPGSGAARAEYAPRSPHRPIQLFTARSPGNQLGRQQVRYFRLENCPFVRRDQRCFVRGKSECDYDTRAPEIQIDPTQPCWCFPCDSQQKSVLTKRTFVKSKFDKNAFGWGKNNSNTFFRQKYHKIKFGYCKKLIQTSKTTIIDIRLYVDKKLLFQGISCRRWA